MQNNLQHLYGASSYLIGSENKLENLEHSLFNIDLKLSTLFSVKLLFPKKKNAKIKKSLGELAVHLVFKTRYVLLLWRILH